MTDSVKPTPGELFDAFVAIVAKLRDPNGGCPWDLEQTHQSLKPYLIEESYETLDSIDHAPEKLPEELGDVLLQVVLHAQLGSDAKTFSISDVVRIVSEKMVDRHPHVFGDKKVSGSADVLRNWEQRKKEKLKKDQSILDGVPRGMPALLRAQRVGEKVARVGFEWRNIEEVRDKVLEEVKEFVAEAVNPKAERAHVESEFGDILFALTQLARRLGMSSEDLLQKSTDKFMRRFKEVERRAGPDIKTLGVEKLDTIWEQVKAEEGAN